MKTKESEVFNKSQVRLKIRKTDKFFNKSALVFIEGVIKFFWERVPEVSLEHRQSHCEEKQIKLRDGQANDIKVERLKNANSTCA